LVPGRDCTQDDRNFQPELLEQCACAGNGVRARFAVQRTNSRCQKPRHRLLVVYVKKFLACRSLRSDRQTKEVVQDWLKASAEIFFDEGIHKMIPHDMKCTLNIHMCWSSAATNMLQ
jgi:hypothetical protein